MIGLPVRSISSEARSRKAASAGLNASPHEPSTAVSGATSDVQPVEGLRRMPRTTRASTTSLSASTVMVRSARSGSTAATRSTGLLRLQ